MLDDSRWLVGAVPYRTEDSPYTTGLPENQNFISAINLIIPCQKWHNNTKGRHKITIATAYLALVWVVAEYLSPCTLGYQTEII